MSACLGITANILLNCDNPPVTGVSDTLYLINRDDIDSITFDTLQTTGSNKLVTSINMLTNKYACKIEGRNNSHEPSSTLRKGRYFDSYEHQVSFKIFDNSPEIKSQIESMVQRGNLVAIVENNYRGQGSVAAFEMYGYQSGLEVTESSRNVNEADTQGGYALTLKTPEQQGEGHLPYSILSTDYISTKQLLEGLLNP